MRTVSSHAPIVRVLTAAGVHVYSRSEKPKIVVSSDSAGRASLALEVDEEQWMEERRRSLARIRERKQARRLGMNVSMTGSSESETETGVGTTQRRLPDRRYARCIARTDSIVEEEEECVFRAVRPTDSPLRGSTDVGDSSDSAEDGTDSSVDTRTLAGSETGSEMGDGGHSSKPDAVKFVHGLSPPLPFII